MDFCPLKASADPASFTSLDLPDGNDFNESSVRLGP